MSASRQPDHAREGSPVGPRHPERWLVVAGIVLLGALAYGPSLGYPYLWDAVPAVERNRVVERAGVTRIFTADYWAGTDMPSRTLYRPVTVTSFALERRLVGAPAPGLSRGVNLLLHALTALALYAYARRLGGGGAVATVAALSFCAHPLALQAVVNVVGRAELQVALFSLAALGCHSYAGSFGRPPRPRAAVHRAAAWGAALFLFLALGSKESAVALPFLLVAQDLVFRAPGRDLDRAWWRRRVATLAPCGLAIVTYLILRTLAIESFPGLQPVPAIDNVLVGLEGAPRWATALGMAARYAGLLAWPAALSADYSGRVVETFDSPLAPLPLVGLLVLAVPAGLALAPLLRRRTGLPAAARHGFVPMAALLFLLPYLVVGNLLVLNGAGFAERLLYVPSLGAFLLAALGAVRGLAALGVARRVWARRCGLALFGVALLGGALHAREQARMWESEERLLERTLRATPRSLRAHFALADLRKSQGHDAEVLGLYERATRHAPEDAAAWLNLGVTLYWQGEHARAGDAFRRSLALRPRQPDAHLGLGLLHLRAGRPGESERALRKALLYDPASVMAAAELADLLFRSGRYAEAATYYRRCVRRGRGDLEPRLREAEARARSATDGGDQGTQGGGAARRPG